MDKPGNILQHHPDWKQGPHGYIDLAADQQAIHAVWLDSRNRNPGVKSLTRLALCSINRWWLELAGQYLAG
jgi:hypothetical protein